MSQVEVSKNFGGGTKRPAWAYAKNTQGDHDTQMLEMAESIRNAIEQLNRSQMLQCDVAYAIKGIEKELRGLRRDLKKKKRK